MKQKYLDFEFSPSLLRMDILFFVSYLVSTSGLFYGRGAAVASIIDYNLLISFVSTDLGMYCQPCRLVSSQKELNSPMSSSRPGRKVSTAL